MPGQPVLGGQSIQEVKCWIPSVGKIKEVSKHGRAALPNDAVNGQDHPSQNSSFILQPYAIQNAAKMPQVGAAGWHRNFVQGAGQEFMERK